MIADNAYQLESEGPLLSTAIEKYLNYLWHFQKGTHYAFGHLYEKKCLSKALTSQTIQKNLETVPFQPSEKSIQAFGLYLSTLLMAFDLQHLQIVEKAFKNKPALMIQVLEIHRKEPRKLKQKIMEIASNPNLTGLKR